MYQNVVLGLLIQLFVAPCIQALGILLPLYIYPGSNCAAWSPVFDAISAGSSAKWYIIVNPDSGPGATDQLYQTCVSQIPPSDDQIIMGFIDTQDGNVERDIDTYAGWPSSARPAGIYFDNINPTASQLSTYQSYVSYAKSKGFTFIGLNPGETTDASYFSMADLVNTYEDSYSSFNADSLSGTISKQSVTLVNAPATGSYSAVISQLQTVGAAAVYITNVADTDQDLPAQLSEFASEIASAGGGSTSGSSPSNPSNPSNPSTPSDPSNPAAPSSPSNSPNTSSLKGSSSKTMSGASTKSSPSSGSATGSAVKGDIPTGTPSGQSPGLPQSSNGPNQATVAGHQGPPIAAIVGGVLGAFVILLVLLVLFLCIRRRRRGVSGSPETVAPFPVEIVHDRATTSGSSQDWPQDMKAPLSGTDPEMSTLDALGALTSHDPTSAVRVSVAPTYGSTTARRVSAAPTYGSARESLAGSAGAPPSYHN
ncbi:Spherulation-specific family 4-domain-containing protein [Mycena alexandri]|uniref:Spherulation-specific family 4-domain-containing protein n=1 Tax=Mycena alexandri TaxID=1745969 RepID=A0AAD6S3N3_9AGAR|nr:Spherulation-specific family 4-domain-containing protein [Mycena alexandri]